MIHSEDPASSGLIDDPDAIAYSVSKHRENRSLAPYQAEREAFLRL